MTDLIKATQPVDGFEGFESRREGDDRPESGSVIQGTIVKFTNDAAWMTRDDDELPANLELVATDVIRLVQKWIDGMPVETRILAPGEKFPDLDALNEAAPKSEWREGPNGKMHGPHQSQYIVHLLDPKTMDRFSFATGTVGGGIAVRELRDKVTWMRRLRGQNVFAVVTLADRHMKTRFGGRQRPHFNVTRWITLGTDDTTALPAPSSGPLPPREVTEPTLAEELNDDIPTFDA